MLKKSLRYLRNIILAFLAFIVLYLAIGFCLSKITVNKNARSNGPVTIFINTNGVHADIVVPVTNAQKDWSRDIKFANTAAKDTTMPWLGLGWGDKGFYLETPEWKDLKFSVAFKAAFGLSTTAIHATFYNQLNESETCKKILMNENDYAKLISYISNSLEKDAYGNVQYIQTNANYGNTDAFYEATGSYSMLHTCNSWTNKALKVSGQKACLWTAFDTGIFEKYKN